MNDFEFLNLSNDLRALATEIPLNWGRVQTNHIDDKINMFQIADYQTLEESIVDLNDEHKNYLRRRWYLWKCSQCDEYLFYINNNVEQNPNPYDKSYDIIINNNLAFDIKGTVIPYKMRNRANEIIADPTEMIHFFYTEQSTGRRYDIQNRLFIVHHSFVDTKRELYLRCAWQTKKDCYNKFSKLAQSLNFIPYDNVMSGVIFVLEYEKGKVEVKICGENESR